MRIAWAATANAIAWEVLMPLATKIAAPAPAGAAAPAGAIGGALDAAAATRNASARVNETLTPSAARRKNTPTARATQQASTKIVAFHASRAVVVCSASHRPT